MNDRFPVLVLGATGMLGHQLLGELRSQFAATGTVRGDAGRWSERPQFQGVQLLGGVQANDFQSVIRACAEVRPRAVVNCIGIVKQLREAKDPIVSLEINSLFPHRLAQLCQAMNARLIHISTDCVFSGTRGNYSEQDAPDATDLYGRSKHLGEVAGPGCLTLRTSIIGSEIGSANGLLEWLLSNRGGRVRGYTNAKFSGFTTQALAKLIARILREKPSLEGLWHLSSEPISKYDLLCRLNSALGLEIEIEPESAFHCDRTLDSSRLRQELQWQIPGWQSMIDELRESTPATLTAR